MNNPETLDYVRTSLLIEKVARALASADGHDPDKRVHLVPTDFTIYSEATGQTYPIVSYGPVWLRYRRDAFKMSTVMKSLGLVEELPRSKYASPRKVRSR